MRVFSDVVQTPRNSNILEGDVEIDTVEDLTLTGVEKTERNIPTPMSSRFSHCCERCTPRNHQGNQHHRESTSPSEDWFHNDLASLTLDSTPESEDDLELPFLDEPDDAGEIAVLTPETNQDDALTLPELLSATPETSIRPPDDPFSPSTPSTITTTTFKRVPPLGRLRPLKLRTAMKGSLLGRLRGQKLGASDEQKAPVALNASGTPRLTRPKPSGDAGTRVAPSTTVLRPLKRSNLLVSRSNLDKVTGAANLKPPKTQL
ncbi:unnamed protein product [Mesocestoides corti]|nr:unnamed protein product [Mesocestoides corti]